MARRSPATGRIIEDQSLNTHPYAKQIQTQSALFQGYAVCRPDEAAHLQRAVGGQSLRCFHAGGRRTHRREDFQRVCFPLPQLPSPLHAGHYVQRGLRATDVAPLRPGHLHARHGRDGNLRHRPPHQAGLSSDSHRHPDSFQSRGERADGQRRPQCFRVRLLLAGQYGLAGVHHQTDRGQDELGARCQSGGCASHPVGGGRGTFLLLRPAQPLQVCPSAEPGVQYRSPECPPAHPAYARPPQDCPGPYL